jgi:hypothetical protein
MEKFIIEKKNIDRLIQIIREEIEGDYYKISAQDYLELLKAASYNPKVTGIKKFQGNPLYIVGNVDLSYKPITSLGNVAFIDGNLDIQSTKISSLGETKVKGYINDWGSTMAQMRIRREELKMEAEAENRRQEGEWDLTNENIDKEGLAAHALFNHLVNNGDLVEMDEETKEEIKILQQKEEEIQERYYQLKDSASPEELEKLSQQGIDILNEIEELRGDKADVYSILPQSHQPWGVLYAFEVIGLRGQEYLVGKHSDFEKAAIEYEKDLIDDIGIESLSRDLIENNIDLSQVRDEIEEFYRDDISNNPEAYFDDDDYELTPEQEERKERLELEIEELKEKLENTENEDEIADLETEIEESQEELDSIEPDTEPTDDMIDDKVNYYVRNTDEIGWLKEMGSDLKYYVNIEGIAEDIVNDDGIEVMARYDGRSYEEQVKAVGGINEWFTIMRSN